MTMIGHISREEAKERELRERAENNMRVFIEKEHTPIVEQLRKQVDEQAATVLSMMVKIGTLEQAQKSLVDALKYVYPFFENGCNVSQALSVIDAALARIGDK